MEFTSKTREMICLLVSMLCVGKYINQYLTQFVVHIRILDFIFFKNPHKQKIE